MGKTAGHPRKTAFGIAPVMLMGAMLAGAWASPAQADERPALITFGRDAPTREGDFYHEQTIYVSVPEGSTERLWINVFDPGIGPEYRPDDGAGRGEPDPLCGVRRPRRVLRFPRWFPPFPRPSSRLRAR